MGEGPAVPRNIMLHFYHVHFYSGASLLNLGLLSLSMMKAALREYIFIFPAKSVYLFYFPGASLSINI